MQRKIYPNTILLIVGCICMSTPVLSAQMITFDTRGVCYIDGKPFFPIGMYHVAPGPVEYINENARKKKLNVPAVQFHSLLDDFKDKGFNTAVFTWREITTPVLREYERRGLYVIADCAHLGPESQLRMFELGRSSDNILMWYGYDEPAGERIALSKDFYTHVKIHDIQRPIGAATPTIRVLPKVLHSLDVVMPDYYTIRADQTLADLADWLAETYRIAQTAGKPMWVVPQAHACVISSGVQLDLPATRQLRCQAYISLIHGATGLIWYSLYTGEYHDNPNGREHFFLPDHDIWPYFKTLNEEISTVAEKIVLKAYRLGPVECDNSSIRAALWKTHDISYLIAVNPADTPSQYVFSNLNVGKVKTMFDSTGNMTLQNGTLADTLDPYGVRVYILEQSD